MSLNPVSSSNRWNFSNQQREDFSLEFVGTVLCMQEVQARTYNPNSNRPGAPRFWDDGNPMMNIRVGFADQNGQFKTFTFQPAGKAQREGKKPSVHMQLFALTGNTSMENLIGKTVKLETWTVNPETGQPWGQGNPRQFKVELVPDVTYELAPGMSIPSDCLVPYLLANDGASGGQPAPQQQVQQQPVQQYVQQQPVQQYVQPQQIQPQQVQQPVTMEYAPTPSGMDPAIAAAMQSIGATNVQPYNDEETPF